jgi:hypothetical protein
MNSIFDDVYKFLGRYASYPSEHAKVSHVLWIAHTYLIDKFYTTPRLTILSAEKGSGKTRILDLTEVLVLHPSPSVNMSPAALWTEIATNNLEGITTCILLDETDNLFVKKETNDILGVLNAGFQRGKPAKRCIFIEGKRTLEVLECFAPVCLCGIDVYVPDTIMDRSIVIRMKKRSVNEKIENFRPKNVVDETKKLRERLQEWAHSVKDKVDLNQSTFSAQIVDRLADKWEPLIQCADLYDECNGVTAEQAFKGGGLWGDKARGAALASITQSEEEYQLPIGTMLLKDIKEIFDSTAADKEVMKTEDILFSLRGKSDGLWDFFTNSKAHNPKPITTRELSDILRKYGIAPRTIRFNDKPAKGYSKQSFVDPWFRYVPMPLQNE